VETNFRIFALVAQLSLSYIFVLSEFGYYISVGSEIGAKHISRVVTFRLSVEKIHIPVASHT
jgi:hypothetical protein